MKKQKLVKIAAMMLFSSFICATIVFSSMILLTEEQAIKEMFPDVDKVEKITLTLDEEQLTAIKNRLGGSLVHFQEGAANENIAEETEIQVFAGFKNGEKVRIAIIDTQPGKWGPVKYIVAVDTKTGSVNNLAVLSYTERRGQPIARNNFLRQFVGKTVEDPITVRAERGVRRDIRAVSGATIPSDATCFSVRKVLSIFSEAM